MTPSLPFATAFATAFATSLPRSARPLAVALLAGLCLSIPLSGRADTAADARAWTLDRLMSTLAQRKSGQASFVETRYLAIAAKPVESSGELAFAAPDHLEKLTERPKHERLVVDGDKLTVERDRRKFTVSLGQYPDLAAFIESIRATLAGNRYALEQLYRVSVDGHGDDWTLTLTPLDSRMLKAVRIITLAGTRDMLRTVVIEQPDGDRSVMQLRHATNE
jgi:outer membrane lipoprotein-sorting protein